MPFPCPPTWKGWRRAILTALTLACLGAGAWAQGTGNSVTPQNKPVATPPAPDARIEFFGAERGYAVRGDSVTFLGIVRNEGNGPLPENALRLRLFPAAGLDYTSGDTLPRLPALAPGQAIAFRWRLALSADRGPLVAGILLENAPQTTGAPSPVPTAQAAANGGGSVPISPTVRPAQTPPAPLAAPSVALTVVPRLSAPPSLGSLPVKPDAAPAAEADAGQAWVGNERMGARLVKAEMRLPVLLLAGREGANWRAVATGTPLARARSGEEGQNPWWETFRWRDTRLDRDQNTATLTLQGTIGARWRSELILTAQRNSSALNGRLRLTALRPVRLYSVELPLLLVQGESADAVHADGSAQAVAVEAPLLPDNARVAADRRFGMTFGLAWPSALPLPGWHAAALPAGDGDRLHVLGAQFTADERGDLIPKGATVEFPFRLFVLSPSDTVRDALRFALP